MFKKPVTNQIDVNDFQYVSERNGLPVSSHPCPQNKLTGKINPNVSQFKILGKSEQTVSVFHVKPVYYEHVSSTDENLVFRPMYEVCTHYGNRLVILDYAKLLQVHPRYIEWLEKRMVLIGGQVLITSPFSIIPSPFSYTHRLVHASVAKPKIGMTVTTVYPDPDPETTTVDGLIYRNMAASWATHRAATTALGALPSAATQWGAVLGSKSSSWYHYYRAFFLFDTSSIPDTDTIDSATLSLSVNSLTNTGNAMSLAQSIIASNPASNTDLVPGDFDNVTFTRQATDKTWASMPSSGYADWTFNATGLSNISKTGVSKFAQAHANDVDNSEPTLNATDSLTGFDMDYSEQTGTASDPKLAVTHSTGVITQALATTAQATAGRSSTHPRNISTTAQATASVLKGLSKSLATIAQATAGLLKSISHTLSATAQALADITKTQVTPVLMAVTASATAGLTKIAINIVNLAVTAQASVNIAKTKHLLVTIGATAQATAGLVKSGIVIMRTLAVTAGASVSFTKGLVLSKMLSATAQAVVGMLKDYGYIDKYPENSTTYSDKYPES